MKQLEKTGYFQHFPKKKGMVINMAELTSMMNIGKEMSRKLKSVGIDSAEKLIETGAKEAFFKLKSAYPSVCLVHLYTLEGAITNTEYNSLSEDKKKDLKKFGDLLKG